MATVTHRGGEPVLCSGQFAAAFESQGHVHHRAITHRGIQHGLVPRAIGPLDLEILLNIVGAFQINRVYEKLRFLVALATS